MFSNFKLPTKISDRNLKIERYKKLYNKMKDYIDNDIPKKSKRINSRASKLY